MSSVPYADTAPCGRCGKPVALDHDPPCPHGHVGCPECTHAAVCAACWVVAERELFAGNTYDPTRDPFFDHTVTERVPDRAIYLDGARWRYRDTDEEVETDG